MLLHTIVSGFWKRILGVIQLESHDKQQAQTFGTSVFETARDRRRIPKTRARRFHLHASCFQFLGLIHIRIQPLLSSPPPSDSYPLHLQSPYNYFDMLIKVKVRLTPLYHVLSSGWIIHRPLLARRYVCLRSTRLKVLLHERSYPDTHTFCILL